MEISPIRILQMTAVSLLFGICVGILNDIHRVIRVIFGNKYNGKSLEGVYDLKLPVLRKSLNEIKNGRTQKHILWVVMFIQDIALFVFSGAGIAILNYYFNNGRARLYTPAAVLIGFLAYFFTVGRVVVYFSEALAFFIKASIAVVLATFSKPIVFIVAFFGNFVKKIFLNVNKGIAKKQKMVYNINKESLVIKEAARGFTDLEKK